MSKYIKNAYFKQQTTVLTLQELLTIVANKTGHHPKQSGKGYLSCCPAHNDRYPSLSIAEGEDGKILMRCHAGCTIHDICTSLGIEVKDLFPSNKKGASHGRN